MEKKSKSPIVGIRMSNAIIAKLDELVKKGEYKSRSDCVKTLIEERYSEVAAAEGIKGALLELIKGDSDVFAALAEVFDKYLTERETAAETESA